MSRVIEAIQDVLNFDGCKGAQFCHNGLGKIGTTGFLIGAVGGIHFGIVLTLTCLVSFTPSHDSIKYAVVSLVCFASFYARIFEKLGFYS